MIFIGYLLSTTGLKQFTKLCFYGYSEAYAFNSIFYIFLLLPSHFYFLHEVISEQNHLC